MVDAPWLSPGESSGAFFIFWSIVNSQWSVVSCQWHWSFVISPLSSLSPYSPIAPLLLGVETTSGKGRFAK